MKKFIESIGIITALAIVLSLFQTTPSQSASSVTNQQFQALATQVKTLQSQVANLVKKIGENSELLDNQTTNISDLFDKLDTLKDDLGTMTVVEAGFKRDFDLLKVATQSVAKRVLASAEPYVYQVECNGSLGSAWGISIVFRADDTAAGYQGAVVTNYHVVSSCLGSNVRVSQNGRTLGGKVSNWDQTNDLALIKTIGTTNSLPVSSSAPLRGDFAMTLGSPYGLEGSISQGIVSNLNGDFVITDAAIDPGNSGGPLLNANGELIGINTWRYVGSQGSGAAIKPGVICRTLLVCATGSYFLTWSR